MQLFIGGACAGKRDLVAARFPDAVWHRLDPDAPESWRDALVPGAPLVLTGWASWLEGALEDDSDDDRLRARLAAMLETLVEVEAGSDGEVVLILRDGAWHRARGCRGSPPARSVRLAGPGCRRPCRGGLVRSPWPGTPIVRKGDAGGQPRCP